jgi:RHS repeat-associated protein
MECISLWHSHHYVTGKERDATTGLDYFGARYYDPWRGGRGQVDPWDYKYPSQSPYCYCSLNPIRRVDSTGRGPWDIIDGIINSISDNNTLGLSDSRTNAHYDNASDGRLGEEIGDVVSLVQSASEFVFGAGAAAGGTGVSIGGIATGPGELVLAPAGVVVAGHATTVGVTAAFDLRGGNKSAKRAYSTNPYCPLVQWDLACALYKLNKNYEAIKIWKKIISKGENRIADDECGAGKKWAQSLINDSILKIVNILQAFIT